MVYRLLNPTLDFAASALKLDAGAELSFIAPDIDEKVPNGWGELDFGIDGPKRTKFVVGIVWDKTREWTYDKVRQRQGSAVELITPLSWLSHVVANYVFVVTPDHIVLCAKKIDEAGKFGSWRAMPVPLFGTPPNGLTAELGLWALCMLGLLDHVQQQQAKQAEPDTDAETENSPWGDSELLRRFKAEFFKSGFVVEEGSDDDANEDQTSLV